jgi:hypothetical protein
MIWAARPGGPLASRNVSQAHQGRFSLENLMRMAKTGGNTPGMMSLTDSESSCHPLCHGSSMVAACNWTSELDLTCIVGQLSVGAWGAAAPANSARQSSRTAPVSVRQSSLHFRHRTLPKHSRTPPWSFQGPAAAKTFHRPGPARPAALESFTICTHPVTCEAAHAS